MRITTQMINESARRTGLPIHGNSLLNYVNQDSSTNSLLKALDNSGNNTNYNNTVNSVKRSSYEKLEKAAEKLLEKAEFFTTQGENSIFEKARETEDNQEIYDAAKALVDNYNSTVKSLESTSSTLNDYYKQMLEEVILENKEALGNIGISLSSNDTLSIDETKMKSADVDSLEKALGTSGTFSTKVAFLASRVSANAETNMASLSSTYGSSGDIYSAINNKFDLWG